ncbi:unnamed protein product [Rangifer tarandus platyrhynchus]|uniref:Uncharacterized protein n=2 Tax=Rangifer tarandus platyrhynchus TaxID=3082113 RepID=A0ABN8YLF8_RANTA|nr:unnamed protein product [Rangifer tarandus platyrhynchus]CAI9696704.1 unnamed protein product [Rangifer tarandus platyrhynchus]
MDPPAGAGGLAQTGRSLRTGPQTETGEVNGVDREGLRRWSSQLPERRGFVAARGPGRLTSRPPARAPQSAPGAARAMLAAAAAAAACAEKAAAAASVRTR